MMAELQENPNLPRDAAEQNEPGVIEVVEQNGAMAEKNMIDLLRRHTLKIILIIVVVLFFLYIAKVNFYDSTYDELQKAQASIQLLNFNIERLAIRSIQTDFRLTNYYKLLTLKSQLQAMKLAVLYDRLKTISKSKTQDYSSTGGELEQYLNYQLEHSDSLLALNDVYQVPRLIFVKNFAQLKAENVTWTSEPFYSGPKGYKMELIVLPNGYNSHISVLIKFLPGNFDESLKWPFRGEITIELLNWRENIEENNYEEMILNYALMKADCGKVNQDCGWPMFVSHDDLKYNHEKNTEYLYNDMLLFKIVSVTLRE